MRFLKKALKVIFYLSASFLIIVSIALIISQTESFRVLIRERVESELKNSFNGEIHLGRFYGNIFTGLGIDGFYIKVDNQTFIKALGVELKYNPIGFIRGSYSFKELTLYKPEVHLIRDRNGSWNFQKVLKPGSKKGEAKFAVSFDKLVIDDGKFILADSLYQMNSEMAESLNCINYHSFVVHDINAILSGRYSAERINIKKLGISFIVDDGKFSAEVDGKFYADRRELRAEGVKISTAGSRVRFSFFANTKGNLFKLDRNTIENVYMGVSLVADSFNFGELAKFIPSVHFLSGSPSIEIDASGTLKELEIDKIKAKIYDSELYLSGRLRNIIKFPEFLIDVQVENSRINISDVEKFVTFVNLPEFKVKQVNFVGRYSGHPLDFNSNVILTWDRTQIELNGALKISDGLIYDLTFKVNALNPADILNQDALTGDLSFQGSIKGKGVEFETAEARANIELEQSILNKVLIPRSKFWFDLTLGELNGGFVSLADGLKATIDWNLEKIKVDGFLFSLSGFVSDLDISKIRIDEPRFLRSHISGNFNIKFQFGKTNIMDLFAQLNPSYFGNYKINLLRLNARYIGIGDKKNLGVYSNVFDLTINGKFNFDDFVKSLVLSAKTLASKIKEKVDFKEFEPVNFSEIKEPVDLDYKIKLKNLTPISVFSIGRIFQAVGTLSGSFLADSQGFYFYNEAILKRMVYLDYKDGQIDSSRTDSFNSTVEINYNANGLRIKSVNQIKNIASKIFTTEDIGLSLDFDGSGVYAKLSIGSKKWNFNAILASEFNREVNKFALMDLEGDIYGNEISITDEVEVFQTKNGFVINPASFILNGQRIYISGFIDRQTQQLKIWGDNLELGHLSGVNVFSGNVNFYISIYGAIGRPNSEIEVLIKDFKYKNIYLGNFECTGTLGDEMIDISSSLTTEVENVRYRSVDAHLLIPAWFNQGTKGKYRKPYINGNIKLLRFPVALFEPLFDEISDLRGDITGGINVDGTFESPNFNGSFSLQNCTFRFNPNSKYYIAYGTGRISSNVIYIEDLSLWNNPDDYENGEVQIKGALYVDRYSIARGNLNINGRLLIVDKEGFGLTGLYGRVIVETGRNGLNLRIDTTGVRLNGEILLTEVDVNYLSKRSGMTMVGGGFEYIYGSFADTTLEKEDESEDLVYFDAPVKVDSGGASNGGKRGVYSKLDYDLRISTVGNAKLNLILNPQTGEEFFAEFNGSLRTYSGLAYGEINITDRSYYNFFKRLNASGRLKFVGNLQNPEIDITASYTGTHTVLADTSGYGKVETIQIKLLIGGTLSKPTLKIQMFVDGEDYQTVYPHGEVESDAISFLITGRFKDELARGEATALVENLWSSTGASILSSTISGVITEVLRDVFRGFITSAELGYYSDFKGLRIAGNIGGAVIQFGGDIFTDISKSVITIQYPLFGRLFGRNLIIEYQRKPIQFYQEKEIINKLGLYYKIRL